MNCANTSAVRLRRHGLGFHKPSGALDWLKSLTFLISKSSEPLLLAHSALRQRSGSSSREFDGCGQSQEKTQTSAVPLHVPPHIGQFSLRRGEPAAAAGPLWLHEIKHDGYRIIACKSGGQVRLWSRNGRDWSREFLAVAEALRALREEEIVLDGEAMAHCKDGLPDFHGLRSGEGGAAACCSPSPSVDQ
jgi:ATP-dependent DNA ligase